MVEKNGEKLAKKGESLIRQSLLSSRAYITHLLHNILSLWRLGTLTSHSQPDTEKAVKLTIPSIT